jgi:hypothetical protein
MLKELQPGKYDEYLLPDGTVVVRMKKLSYGYVEAAHYWWRHLTKTFQTNGYTLCKKGKCIFIKRDNERVALCGTTVDDCLFVCSRDEEWIQEQIGMMKKKYDERMIEHGDELGLIGMQIQMDRREKKVMLMQPKQVKRIIEAFWVTKGVSNPASVHSKRKHPTLFGNIGCQFLPFKIGWHNCSIKQHWVVNPMLLTTLVDCRHCWVTTLGFLPMLMTMLGCKFYRYPMLF